MSDITPETSAAAVVLQAIIEKLGLDYGWNYTMTRSGNTVSVEFKPLDASEQHEQVCECGHSEVWHMQACNYPTHGDECKCGCREFRPAKEKA